jgi:hypothetical protein
MSISRWRNSEDGSLVMAMLAAIVISGLVVVLVARTQTSEKHVRFDRDFQTAINGADAGVQQAVNVLSTLTQEDIVLLPVDDEGRPRFCSAEQDLVTDLGTDRFDWCALLDPDSRSWAITSTGSSFGVERTVELDISPDPLFFVGAFGRIGVRMLGNNLAASYPTAGFGSIGSNGWVDMSGNATADVVMLMGEDAYCAGDFDEETNTCNGVPINGHPTKLDFPAMIDDVDAAMAAECPEADVNAEVFDVNDPNHNPLQGGKTYCFARFDVGNQSDIRLSDEATRFKPATVYITEGPFTLGGHTELNCRNTSGADICDGAAGTFPDSGALQIFTNVSEVRIGNQSQVAAAILAPSATCRGNPSAAHFTIYGSLICHQVGQNNPGNQGGWTFWFDKNLLEIGGGSYRAQGYREEAPHSFSVAGD